MKWTRRKVLVTGGASFIGSHLVEKLVQRRAQIRVADNFSSGTDENLGPTRGDIELASGDLRDRAFADKTMDDIDVVFHLAASHGGRGYISSHRADCSSNMVLDGVVFDSAQRASVAKLCFASSACVYPKALQSADNNRGKKKVFLSEEMADPFIEGRAFADEEYGWAKLMGEMSLRAYHEQYGLKGVSCRIFTAYGPRENETHAVVALIAKAYIGMDPFQVWGSGQQDRNFTYVDDIAEGLIRATERIEDASAINIGTENHLKIIDLAQMIFEQMDFKPKSINFDTSRPEGVFSRAADLTKAKRLLEWEPKTSIDEGLKRTIDWYTSTHSLENVNKTLEKTLYERWVP